MEPILKIENLTHTYSAGTPFERRAVDGVNLEVAPGEFLGVIGHTGSGKSTFIQHLNGLLRPTEGRILLEGRDIWAEPKKIRRVRFEVGLVFQYPEYQLFEETVYKDIAFGPGASTRAKLRPSTPAEYSMKLTKFRSIRESITTTSTPSLSYSATLAA